MTKDTIREQIANLDNEIKFTQEALQFNIKSVKHQAAENYSTVWAHAITAAVEEVEKTSKQLAILCAKRQVLVDLLKEEF